MNPHGHVNWHFKQQLERVIEQYKTLNNREALAEILIGKAAELVKTGDWIVSRYQG
jgi:hypothetical protein